MNTTGIDRTVSHRRLRYPVFLIENRKGQEFSGYSVVESKSGFVALGRVAASEGFVEGLVFDSAGYVYDFKGACGWPRFKGWSKPLLEALIIPSLLVKVMEFFIYFGPNLKSRRKVSLAEFKTGIVNAVSRFENHDVMQLEGILSEKIDYTSAIESVDWFRYFGGQRDELGLPV